jgi:type II secretory pathway pseudopilin PulG
MNQNLKRSEAAFTMIEVALSIAILSIGLVSMIGIMPSLLRSNVHSIEFTEVAILAQQDMERYLSNTMTPGGMTSIINTGGKYEATYDLVMKESPDNRAIVGEKTIRILPAEAYSIKGGTDTMMSSGGNHLLAQIQITYVWPKGATQPFKYTFATEITANKNVGVEDPFEL